MVANPEITPVFVLPGGRHSPGTQIVGVFLFELVNERIGVRAQRKRNTAMKAEGLN